jgi:hypothetical protein
VLLMVLHLEKQVGLLYGVNTDYCTGCKHSVISSQSRNRLQTFIFSDLLESNIINVSQLGTVMQSSSGKKCELDTSYTGNQVTERSR